MACDRRGQDAVVYGGTCWARCSWVLLLFVMGLDKCLSKRCFQERFYNFGSSKAGAPGECFPCILCKLQGRTIRNLLCVPVLCVPFLCVPFPCVPFCVQRSTGVTA
ncbi:unnamed protein product [Discosporangium mesarthrocarpum]